MNSEDKRFIAFLALMQSRLGAARRHSTTLLDATHYAKQRVDKVCEEWDQFLAENNKLIEDQAWGELLTEKEQPKGQLEPLSASILLDVLNEALYYMKCNKVNIPCKAILNCKCEACKEYAKGQMTLDIARKLGLRWE